LEAEAAGNGGAVVLDVVAAGGDAGGVEELVWADGPVGVGEGEPVEVLCRSAGRGPGGSTRAPVPAGGR
jgi:hypothetical protein